MSSLDGRSSLSLILEILERKDKIRLCGSLVLIVIGTVLEMASLGLVIPVVQAVTSGEMRSYDSWLPDALLNLSFPSFVKLLMFVLVVVFVVKNLLLLFLTYYQQRVQLSVSNRIVQRLFEKYLRQPYEFHLTNSSSVLVRNLQEYSSAVMTVGVTPAMNLLTDSLTGLGLFGILVVVRPVDTILLLAVMATGFVTIAGSRKRTRRWGAERIRHRGEVMETLLGGFGGIKEIQLFGRDRVVIEAHQRSLYKVARSSYLFGVLQNVPRAILEVMTVGGVSLLVVLATFGGNAQDATLLIALFGVVAFRLLPSASRMIQSIQQLSFGRTALEGAVQGLSLPQVEISPKRVRATDKFELLEIKNLQYSYPNTEAVVTDIASLSIQAGESVGVIGTSGSGKSTLVDLLIGILTPKVGTISVNGRDISTDRRYWQDRIGYVPQHVYLMDTTIRRNVAFGLNEKEIESTAVERALRQANLWEFVQSLPQGLDTVVGERGVRLSGGQRQRLGIARALYGNPEVIVLDEATSALDADTEREIVESFREIAHDHTLIVVAHRTSTLAYCNRLIRLEDGRIVQEGTYAEVIGSLPNT